MGTLRQRKSKFSRVPTPAPSASCPPIIEYDVSVFVDFQHRLELAVRNNIHRLRECRGEVNFDAQLAPLHEVEGNTISHRRPVSDQTRRRCIRCRSQSVSDHFLRPATLCQWSRTGLFNSGRDNPGQSLAGGVSLVPVDRPRRLLRRLCRCALHGTGS